MLAIGKDTTPRGKAPHLYRLVIASRSKEFPIRRPYYSIHRKAGMTGVSEDSLAAAGIPHLHRAISAGRSDTLPIGRPRDGSHARGVTTTDPQGGSQGLRRYGKGNRCRSDLWGIRLPGYLSPRQGSRKGHQYTAAE